MRGPEAKNRTVIVFVIHTRSLSSKQPPPPSNLLPVDWIPVDWNYLMTVDMGPRLLKVSSRCRLRDDRDFRHFGEYVIGQAEALMSVVT